MTPLREMLTRPKALCGPFLAIPSPMVVEIACASGPDFVCIDQEHSAIPSDTLENMLRAAAVHRVPALVRVPGLDAMLIAKALDSGADGVLVPHVSTEEDARHVVRASRFPPEGRRGAGPGRSAGYGRDIPRSVESARRGTLVGIQLETVEALANLPAILAVPGIDLAFIGPGDLGVSLKAAGRSCPDALGDAIEMVLKGAAEAGVPAGIFCMTRAEAEKWTDRLGLVICGSDTTQLIEGLEATFAQ